MVYDLLHENGMERFYQLESHPGTQQADDTEPGAYDFLAEADVRAKLVDFTDGKTTRVTFHLPNIHCIACVWLLERLYKFHDGLGAPEVNFQAKTVHITYNEERISLVEIAKLLDRIGYPPSLRLRDLDEKSTSTAHRRHWLQLGIAGFAFGNVMLLSFPSYLGLADQSLRLQSVFGTLSLLLSIPVLLFSASDYFRAAWMGLRQKELSIEVPIAIGLVALFLQSVTDIVRGVGEGYLDSLAGLVFFLLIGKAFQRRSFDALSFDRDYKSYFPIAALRINADGSSATVPLDKIMVGDRLKIRNQELIPADAVLIKGPALLDYSFVTGESRPENRIPGELLYAGGRHNGLPIEVEVVKELSQGYLTSLWNHRAFKKDFETDQAIALNRLSHWFTLTVLAVAVATGIYWFLIAPSIAVRSFTSILIVACPCALALSAPFAFGNAMRYLRHRGLFLKNGTVVERLATSKHLVFDKTGTLTRGGIGSVSYAGCQLTAQQEQWLAAMVNGSTHPFSRAIAKTVAEPECPLAAFREHEGLGLEAWCDDHHVRLGSRTWMSANGFKVPEQNQAGSECWFAIDQELLGVFRFADRLRSGMSDVLPRFKNTHELHVLSGDRPHGLEVVRGLFPNEDNLRAQQGPNDKLEAVSSLQETGEGVVMFGDGLNDAGALRQSDVGVAVTDDIQAFTPACDAILNAEALQELPGMLRFARLTQRVVYASFTVSLLYNVVGLSFAASGRLSPLIAAILMPLSSVTVIVLATVGTSLAAQRCGLKEARA